MKGNKIHLSLQVFHSFEWSSVWKHAFIRTLWWNAFNYVLLIIDARQFHILLLEQRNEMLVS